MNVVLKNYTNLDTVFYVIIINFFISLIYLIIRIIKKDYKRGVMMSFFILLSPPIGVIYLVISWIIYRVYFKNRTGILSIEELSLSKDRVEVTIKDDIRTALNKVPLEEALIVSDKKHTRRLILDVLKEERGDYVNSIYNATDSEDSEVSHYAASAIADIMDKFKEREKMLRIKYNRNKLNRDIADVYQGYLSEFLMTNILSSVEQTRYLKILEDLTLNLEKDMPDVVRAELYYRIVTIAIDLNLMDKAEYWVEKTLTNRSFELESFKAGLKFYYEDNQIYKFKELLERLKTSNVRLDHETLEMIRFYSK